MKIKKADISVKIAGLNLKSPIMVASGTFGYGEEYASLVDINQLGAVVTKGISLQPSKGNPPPRIVETPSGMLNAIGLQNVGLDAFTRDKMPFLRRFKTPVIVNFYGSSLAEYEELAGALSGVEGIAALEANISCPNIKAGGILFGTDASMAHKVTAAIRKQTALPLFVKLTPNVTDIAGIAAAVEDAGADALSLTNTFTGMAVDVKTCRPVLANVTGGLSGPAIKPLALRMVWEVAQRVAIPIVGVGGIMETQDALEFIIAGACAIQIGTALFVDPETPVRIAEGIVQHLIERGIGSIEQITGCLKTS